ncbi:glycoside hydrolase [Paenibacillus sp. TCA20]|uniref:Glycosyltransferase n=1 Tax=Paenibacillus urinalis TaxID=521520 RepID=A0AAX3N1T8_9BACL|nr:MULTISPECIES: glycosyltransferase [Paenibacillus]WDH82597.1 glycosyltransferase [Paenibacillus urinalis]GAK41578.1 glycoside hydrolase [Paenibacillus sp. TCA20]
MSRRLEHLIKKQGVSIITCTNRGSYLSQLFLNYSRQLHAKKELIIVVNNDQIPLEPYKRQAKKYKNVQVFRLPERRSLGACLNYAFKKTKYNFIAKFDDDDYYAPHYLTDGLLSFHKSKADVLGKRAHYMYLKGSKTLILRFPQDENKTVSILPGATLMMKRKVLSQVSFPDQNVGEDDLFCLRSKKKGFKVYSGGRFNFAAIRRKNSSGHTWIIDEEQMIAHNKQIPGVHHFKKFVKRKPKGL